MLSKDQWQAEQERAEDELGDEQAMQADMQKWLADPEAQAEYERWLTTLDKDIARKVQDQLDSFDWFGLEERN